MITDEILDFYFYCQLKAKNRFNNVTFTNFSYHDIHKKLKNESRRLFNPLSIKNTLLKNYQLQNIYFTLIYPYIEIENLKHTPIFFSNHLTITKEDKEKYSFKSILLEERFTVTHYKVITYN